MSSNQKDSLTLVQITDTHIFADADENFDGLNTSASLESVQALIQQTITSPIDLVLVTGDLVHNPLAEAYEKLATMLNDFDCPVMCLPGNHDDPALMEQHLNTANLSTSKSISLNNWQLLLLNSHLPASHAGKLSDSEMQWLKQQLDASHNKHVMLALHHHPVSIASSWMDSMMLQNHADFLQLIGRYDNIKLMVWGHIHQEFHAEYKGITLYGTPSTCVQFLPEADSYTADKLQAGYRQINLYADGNAESTIYRLNKN